MERCEPPVVSLQAETSPYIPAYALTDLADLSFAVTHLHFGNSVPLLCLWCLFLKSTI